MRTLRGFVIPADFALKIELQLMCARINIRKFMMCSPVFPHEEQLANAHLRADFFPAFADEGFGQSFAPMLPTARQHRVSAVVALFEDHEQFSIADDDGFCGIAKFFFLFHKKRLDFTTSCEGKKTPGNQVFLCQPKGGLLLAKNRGQVKVLERLEVPEK